MSEGIGNTIIARLEKNGQRFEVLVDPKLAYAYKTGSRKDFTNVLAFEEIFKDAMRGERQTAEHIKKQFGTVDPIEVAKKIFILGDLQLTTDQRRVLVEEKRRKLVELIARNCVDPRTKAPHPPQRIQNALAEARYGVDAFLSPEEQLEHAIDAIREIIPIRMETAKVQVRIPPQFASRCFGLLKEFGLQKEEWLSDGSLSGQVQMPAGVTLQFYEKLNKLTAGQGQTSLLS